jgi:hypothetical protein
MLRNRTWWLSNKLGYHGLVKVARERMHMLAALSDFREHARVEELTKDAPGWYRYKAGRLRVLFRVLHGNEDTLQITMIDLRDDDTYGAELKRRYRLLEPQ